MGEFRLERLTDAEGFSRAGSRLELMGVIVANQAAGVGGAVVRDGGAAVGGDDVGIKIHQALAGNSPRLRAHAVARVAYRAREAILPNVAGVLAEAGVIHDLIQVMALGAQSIGAAADATLGAQVRVRKQVGNELTRDWRLAELIPALQNMREN